MRKFRHDISIIPPKDVRFSGKSLSEYELILALIEKVNELIKYTNSVAELVYALEKWINDEFIKAIDESTKKTLVEWRESGYLQELVEDYLVNLTVAISELLDEEEQKFEKSWHPILDSKMEVEEIEMYGKTYNKYTFKKGVSNDLFTITKLDISERQNHDSYIELYNLGKGFRIKDGVSGKYVNVEEYKEPEIPINALPITKYSLRNVFSNLTIEVDDDVEELNVILVKSSIMYKVNIDEGFIWLVSRMDKLEDDMVIFEKWVKEYVTTKITELENKVNNQIDDLKVDFNSLKEDLYINVKDFGAVGDGINDDSVAIQNAIDYAVALGQQTNTVYLPNGIYNIEDNTINITTLGRLTIKGAGTLQTKIVYKGTGSAIKLGVSTYFESFWLASATANTGIGFNSFPNKTQINASSNVFRDIHVSNFSKGIVLDGWSNKLINVHVKTTTQGVKGEVGIELCGLNNDNIFEMCKIENYKKGFYTHNYYNDIGGSGVWFRNNDTTGCYYHYEVDGQQNIHILNNYGEFAHFQFVRTLPNFKSNLTLMNNMFFNYHGPASTNGTIGVLHQSGYAYIENNYIGNYKESEDTGLNRALHITSAATIGVNKLGCYNKTKVTISNDPNIVSTNQLNLIEELKFSNEEWYEINYAFARKNDKMHHQYTFSSLDVLINRDLNVGLKDYKLDYINLKSGFIGGIVAWEDIEGKNMGDEINIDVSKIKTTHTDLNIDTLKQIRLTLRTKPDNDSGSAIINTIINDFRYYDVGE